MNAPGAEAAIAKAESLLRACGQRMTGPRRAVLAVLAASREHLTADQVVAAVARGDATAHRASVFRTLDRLTELAVVQRVSSRGLASYHLVAEIPHLHAHCLTCGLVLDLPGDLLNDVQRTLLSAADFLVHPLYTVLSGSCAKCRATAS